MVCSSWMTEARVCKNSRRKARTAGSSLGPWPRRAGLGRGGTLEVLRSSQGSRAFARLPLLVDFADRAAFDPRRRAAHSVDVFIVAVSLEIGPPASVTWSPLYKTALESSSGSSSRASRSSPSSHRASSTSDSGGSTSNS